MDNKYKSLIEKSVPDIEKKEMYHELFEMIFDQYDEVVDRLEKKTKEILKTTYVPPIYTVLARDMDSDGFRRMDEIEFRNGLYYYKDKPTGFLDFGSQSEIDELCSEDRIFVGTRNSQENFRFRLRQNLYFKRLENIVRIINRLYKTKIAVPWSPFAGRFVTIELLDGFSINGDDVVDFGIKELVTDKTIFWNVAVENSERIRTESKTAPFENEERYIITVEHRSADEYLITNEKKAVVEYNDNNGYRVFKLYCGRKNPEFNIVKISELKKQKNMFSNELASNIDIPDRIRAEADASRIAGLFSNDSVKVTFAGYDRLNADSEYCKIHRYTGEAKYRHADEQPINMKSMIVLNLKFEPADSPGSERNFIEDYANFSLSYLEAYYPEFRWAGVTDGIYLE